MNDSLPLRTDDTLFAGRLGCRQHKDGYRFSLDALLAAHFCPVGGRENVLDLGTGSGVIALILAYRHPGIRITGLEVQPALVGLARENASRNGFAERFTILSGDCRAIEQSVPPESFDLVVSNPPYRKTGSGRINPRAESAGARHELHGDLSDFIRAAAYSVRNRGRTVFIYPAGRVATLIAGLTSHRLTPKRLQPVYSYPEAEQATLVLVEAIKNGGEGLVLLAPLYIYAHRNGPYSTTMAEITGESTC